MALRPGADLHRCVAAGNIAVSQLHLGILISQHGCLAPLDGDVLHGELCPGHEDADPHIPGLEDDVLQVEGAGRDVEDDGEDLLDVWVKIGDEKNSSFGGQGK